MRIGPSSLARLVAGSAALCATLGLCACGEDSTPLPMEAGRQRERPDREVPPGAGTRERLGLPLPPPVATVVPARWIAKAPGSMRLLSFGIEGEPQADISVSRARGGVTDNVNRWLNQFGLDPLERAGVEALPRQPLLGVPAARVQAEGTFQGMQGEPLAGQALLGLVSELGPERLFVKFTGPAALVTAQAQAFDQFVAGLAVGEPKGAPSSPAHGAAAAPQPGIDPGQLRYGVTPPGWSVQPATKPFRLAEIRVEGAPPSTLGVVSHLIGDGGGLANNLNRWRGQMGQSDLSESELAALERVEVLGRPAVWIEITGRYRGMGGEDVPDALFLGVVCMLEHDAIFVRLYGPQATVEAQREALRAFVRGMRLEG